MMGERVAVRSISEIPMRVQIREICWCSQWGGWGLSKENIAQNGINCLIQIL